MLDPAKLPFIQAHRFQKANRTHIDWIVIHTMEVGRTKRAALNCARDFATTADARSAHYCIDSESIIHCVQEKDIAFAAPPNTGGMHLEHAGFASLTEAEWQDDYSAAMLHLSAEIAASIAARFDVPTAWLSVQDLLTGKRGFTSHANISNAFHQSDHQDPGPNFPHVRYLALVREALNSSGEASSAARAQISGSTSSVERILRLSDPQMHGADVRAIQQALVRAGYRIEVDGEFGPETERAVMSFQLQGGLSADGVVGPLTWRTLGPT